MTTSSSGLYGNFGQSQYGAAKMGRVGLMKTLSLEGRRNDVRVNCLAPTAATGMTEGILEEQALAALDPALVAPGMLALVRSEEHTSELQSLMRISYAVFCLKKKIEHMIDHLIGQIDILTRPLNATESMRGES